MPAPSSEAADLLSYISKAERQIAGLEHDADRMRGRIAELQRLEAQEKAQPTGALDGARQKKAKQSTEEKSRIAAEKAAAKAAAAAEKAALKAGAAAAAKAEKARLAAEKKAAAAIAKSRAAEEKARLAAEKKAAAAAAKRAKAAQSAAAQEAKRLAAEKAAAAEAKKQAAAEAKAAKARAKALADAEKAAAKERAAEAKAAAAAAKQAAKEAAAKAKAGAAAAEAKAEKARLAAEKKAAAAEEKALIAAEKAVAKEAAAKLKAQAAAQKQAAAEAKKQAAAEAKQAAAAAKAAAQAKPTPAPEPVAPLAPVETPAQKRKREAEEAQRAAEVKAKEARERAAAKKAAAQAEPAPAPVAVTAPKPTAQQGFSPALQELAATRDLSSALLKARTNKDAALRMLYTEVTPEQRDAFFAEAERGAQAAEDVAARKAALPNKSKPLALLYPRAKKDAASADVIDASYKVLKAPQVEINALRDYAGSSYKAIRQVQRGMTREQMIDETIKKAAGYGVLGEDIRTKAEDAADKAIALAKDVGAALANRSVPVKHPVFRGMRVSSIKLQEIMTSDTFDHEGMATSTSTDPEIAEVNFAKAPSMGATYDGHAAEHGVIFQYTKIKRAVPLAHDSLSPSAHELEWLVAPGSRYRITKREIVDGTMLVHCEEEE